VAEDGDREGDADGLETAPVSVGKVSAEERGEVDPEGVESRQTRRSALALTKGSGLATEPGTGPRTVGQGLLDIVGN